MAQGWFFTFKISLTIPPHYFNTIGIKTVVENQSVINWGTETADLLFDVKAAVAAVESGELGVRSEK